MTDDPVLAVWTADRAARVELLGLALIGLLLVLLALHAWALVDRARRRRVERDLDARLAALETLAADRLIVRMARARAADAADAAAAAAPGEGRPAVRPRHEGGRPGLCPAGAAPAG